MTDESTNTPDLIEQARNLNALAVELERATKARRDAEADLAAVDTADLQAHYLADGALWTKLDAEVAAAGAFWNASNAYQRALKAKD